jgi:polyisoprenoid-binding protein YceI
MTTRRMLMLFVANIAIMQPAIAAPESDIVDPGHTYPSIEFSHMGLSIWRGKFNRTHGKIVRARAQQSAATDIVIDAASINFGLAAIDEKARSDDIFNCANYPTASYKGMRKFASPIPKTVDGEITTMGVTRHLTLVINSFKCMPHPMLKKGVCGAGAEADLSVSPVVPCKLGG